MSDSNVTLLECALEALRRADPDLCTWDDLASACESTPEACRAALQIATSNDPRRPLRLHRHGARLGRERDHMASPATLDFVALEAAVRGGDFSTADAMMAAAKVRAPRLPAGCPELQWSNGTALSPGAQRWYLANLLKPAPNKVPIVDARLCGAVDPGLSANSAMAFALWIVDQKLTKSMQCGVPTGFPEILVTLASMRREKAFRRRLASIRGLAARRTGDPRSPYLCQQTDIAPLGVSMDFAAHVVMLGEDNLHWRGGRRSTMDLVAEACWPSGDHESGSRDEWLAQIEAVVNRAAEGRRPIDGATFRERYLRHPLAREVVMGRTVELDGAPHTLDVETTETVEVPDDAQVCFIAEEASVSLPTTLPTLPLARFKKITRQLGFRGLPETDGGTTETYLSRGDWSITLVHTGYGAGWGTTKDVQVKRVMVREHGHLATLSYDGGPLTQTGTTLSRHVTTQVARRLVELT